jgi:hypothetical protein
MILRTKEDQLPPQPPSYDPDALDRALPCACTGRNLADTDVRDAVRRICALADVNPPSRRGRRMIAFSGVATLWVEAALLLGVPVGLA